MEAPPLNAEADFDLAFTNEKMRVQVLAPALGADGLTWACAYTIDSPLSLEACAFGESSLLALVEALRGVSRALYGSAEYSMGQLGAEGIFKGNLFPATSDMLKIAPFPF